MLLLCEPYSVSTDWINLFITAPELTPHHAPSSKVGHTCCLPAFNHWARQINYSKITTQSKITSLHQPAYSKIRTNKAVKEGHLLWKNELGINCSTTSNLEHQIRAQLQPFSVITNDQWIILSLFSRIFKVWVVGIILQPIIQRNKNDCHHYTQTLNKI